MAQRAAAPEIQARTNPLQANLNREDLRKATKLMDKGEKAPVKDPDVPDYEEILFDNKLLVADEKVNGQNRELVSLANRLRKCRNEYIEAHNTFQGKALSLELAKKADEFVSLMAQIDEKVHLVTSMKATPFPVSYHLLILPCPHGSKKAGDKDKTSSVGRKIRRV